MKIGGISVEKVCTFSTNCQRFICPSLSYQHRRYPLRLTLRREGNGSGPAGARATMKHSNRGPGWSSLVRNITALPTSLVTRVMWRLFLLPLPPTCLLAPSLARSLACEPTTNERRAPFGCGPVTPVQNCAPFRRIGNMRDGLHLV